MKPIVTFALSLPLFFAVGCASTQVRRIEAGSPTAITTAGIDVADFKNVAGKLVDSMLAQDPSPFARVQGRKARIQVNRVLNDTHQHFDVSQVTFKITTDLMNSGRTETVTAVGENAPDKGGQAGADEQDFVNDRKQTILPDYSLAGKILQTIARDGNQKEFSYTLQLFLTDLTTRTAVWQGEQIVSKQASRRAVGF